MKINKNDLSKIIENIVYKLQIDENVFVIDPDDSEMQQKISKIKGDTSLYDETEDEIKISNESTYKKSDILKLISEIKNKKSVTDDYLKAIKKTDRDAEYDLTGPGWKSKDKAHKSKKKYNRKEKDFLNDSVVNEKILSKKDVMNMILEKKHNGKLYSKSELLNEILSKETSTKRDWQIDQILQFLNSQDDDSSASADLFANRSDENVDEIYKRIELSKKI